MNEVVTKSDENVISYLKKIDDMRKDLRNMFKDRKTSLNGEKYFTDKELGKLLKLSRRTLQDYRTKRILPYIQFGGKVLYRGSEIQNVLEKHQIKTHE